jgi:hypothetical protein
MCAAFILSLLFVGVRFAHPNLCAIIIDTFAQGRNSMDFKIPDFSKHYQEIGQALVDLLPPSYQKAWAGFDVISDDEASGLAFGMRVFYLKENGRYGDLDKGLSSLYDSFWELHKAYKSAGLASWTTATFQLTNAGKMALDVGYEDVSDPDFDLKAKRQDAWIKKYLGDASLIDWSD